MGGEQVAKCFTKPYDQEHVQVNAGRLGRDSVAVVAERKQRQFFMQATVLD
jgi:hypothetical protein